MVQAPRTSCVTDGCAPSLTELNDYTSNKVKEETDAFEKGNFREGEIRFCALSFLPLNFAAVVIRSSSERNLIRAGYCNFASCVREAKKTIP